MAFEHEAVFTIDECAANYKALPATHTKNLFLKDKRGGFWLLVLPSDGPADLKSLAQALGAGKFSFGKPDELERLLGVAPGSVTSIAAVNAPACAVQVVFDTSFHRHQRIALHPLRHTATIALPFDFIEHVEPQPLCA